MVNITYYEAAAYAEWAGMRLPTEAEWEKAARGRDGQLYPWGDRWDPEIAKRAASVKLYPVDDFEHDASPYGCLGLVSNAREWTSTPYDIAIKPEPGVSAFLAPFAYFFSGITLKTKYARQTAILESLSGIPTDNRVVKGGPKYLRTAFECRASFREDVRAITRDETIGFRCAMDAK